MTLTVTDHGRGFSTEHITKVGAYMQFDRKMQEQQGLGLGLMICKRLTELHGGTLAIQSTQTDGTTITLKLPKIGDHWVPPTRPPFPRRRGAIAATASDSFG